MKKMNVQVETATKNTKRLLSYVMGMKKIVDKKKKEGK